MKNSYHKYTVQLKEFFVNMETVYKISEPYGGDQMMEHPNPKKPHFKNYHQIVATALTFDNSMSVMEKMKAEIKKVINCIMSYSFQIMYIDTCKMMLSAQMVDLSKYHKNIKQNEFKSNLWINMIAGSNHPRIIFKKHLKHGLTNKEVKLMLPKLFSENDTLPSEIIWDPAVIEFACGQN